MLGTRLRGLLHRLTPSRLPFGLPLDGCRMAIIRAPFAGGSAGLSRQRRGGYSCARLLLQNALACARGRRSLARLAGFPYARSAFLRVLSLTVPFLGGGKRNARPGVPCSDR